MSTDKNNNSNQEENSSNNNTQPQIPQFPEFDLINEGFSPEEIKKQRPNNKNKD